VSVHLVPLGRDQFARDLFLMSLGSWNDWPRELGLPSEHFCLLFVGDATGVSDETLERVAEVALDAGCACLCAWGPDCVRVETSFDTECAEREGAHQTPVVLTVAHRDETLHEALEYLTEIAFPASAYADTCRSTLIAVVGNTDWEHSIRRRFGK